MALILANVYSFDYVLRGIIIIKFVEILILILQIKAIYEIKFARFSFLYPFDQVSQSFWLAISNIFGSSFFLMDRFLVSNQSSHSELSNFVIAQDLYSRLAILLGAAVTVMLPYWISGQMKARQIILFSIIMYILIKGQTYSVRCLTTV